MAVSQVKSKAQQVVDAVEQLLAVEFALATIDLAAMVTPGLIMPPIRRDANGADHPEQADLPELQEWGEDVIAVCEVREAEDA